MSVAIVKKFVLIGAILALFSIPVHSENLAIDDDAPDFSLKNSGGQLSYSLKQYRGKKIVYLDFFATWCTTCREEMSRLKELNSRYKNDGLEVIAINVQESPDKVNKFIAKYEIPFPVLLDEKAEVAKLYNLVGFPFNLIIDGNGTIKYMGSEPPKNFAELFSDLKDTLKAPVKAAPAKINPPAAPK